MAKGFSDTSRTTGRRGFFRQLMVSAIESVEKVGREMADRGLKGFEPPAPPRYVPPPPARQLDPKFVIYGPPWPPPYGPYLTPALRAKLRAQALARSPLSLAVPAD
jgi:hypothetical protein